VGGRLPREAYSPSVIDTHCHLTFPDFAGRIEDVLSRAHEHGVTGAITVSTTTRDCLAALEIAKGHDRVWCTAGVHPLYSDQGPHEWHHLRTVAEHEKCVAWGELGLDNHYDRPARAIQHGVLAEQLAFLEACRHPHVIIEGKIEQSAVHVEHQRIALCQQACRVDRGIHVALSA
jgi:TatD DNase family protein